MVGRVEAGRPGGTRISAALDPLEIWISLIRASVLKDNSNFLADCQRVALTEYRILKQVISKTQTQNNKQ